MDGHMIQKLLYVLLIILAGCRKDHRDRTAAGWWFDWHDRGTIETGLHSLGELHDLFDAAMVRSCAEVDAAYSFPPGTCAAKMRKEDPRFEIRDNFYFPVEGTPVDAPGAQYATGETMNRFWVILAFWNRVGPVLPPAPADAPPWTLVQSIVTPGDIDYGTETPGDQYPALSYELHWFFSQDSKFP